MIKPPVQRNGRDATLEACRTDCRQMLLGRPRTLVQWSASHFAPPSTAAPLGLDRPGQLKLGRLDQAIGLFRCRPKFHALPHIEEPLIRLATAGRAKINYQPNPTTAAAAITAITAITRFSYRAPTCAVESQDSRVTALLALATRRVPCCISKFVRLHCSLARIDYSSDNLWSEARFYLWAEQDSLSSHSFSTRPPSLGGHGELILIFVGQSIIWSFHTGGGAAYVSSLSSARSHEVGHPITAGISAEKIALCFKVKDLTNAVRIRDPPSTE
ncbi:hypothetical protein V8E51_018949 [Hyaloscypha variabilis]